MRLIHTYQRMARHQESIISQLKGLPGFERQLKEEQSCLEFFNKRIIQLSKVEIGFVKAVANAKLPTYGSEEAAGADLYSVEEYTITPGKVQLVDTGLDCVIPEGYEIQVRPRSGLALKQQVTVLNTPGTVDSDYSGRLGVILVNHSDKEVEIKVHDRVAQIVVAPVTQANFVWSEDKRDTDRGDSGYGSTGV